MLEECRQEADEEDARRRAEMSLLRNRAERDVTDALLNDVISEQVRDVVTQHVREQQVRALLETVAHEEQARILRDVTTTESFRVIDDVYQTDVIERLQVLQECAAGVHLMTKARFWSRWRNRFASRVRLRRSMLNFPSSPAILSPVEQVRRLLPASARVEGDCVSLGAKRSRLTLQSPVDVDKNRKR